MTENYHDWNRVIQISPPENERILVSDGDNQVIAFYTDNTWIFDNHSLKDMEITWWKSLPKDPPIVQSESNA
jgi:hypothetical protein